MDAEGVSSRESKGQAARERILDAALELFARRGFDATTTKRIAEEAGVPSGLIFYYFDTKKGVLQALMRERSALPRLRSLLEESTGTDTRSTLINIGCGFFEAVEREEPMIRVIFGELHLSSEVSDTFRELSDEGLRLISSYLAESVAAGRLRPVDVEVFARLFLYSVVFAAVFKRPEDPKSFVERSVDFLLGEAGEKRTPKGKWR